MYPQEAHGGDYDASKMDDFPYSKLKNMDLPPHLASGEGTNPTAPITTTEIPPPNVIRNFISCNFAVMLFFSISCIIIKLTRKDSRKIKMILECKKFTGL